MNVLSLFDGISCARFSLEKSKIKIGRYYASEIDKYAIKVSLKNYPDIIQLGNVKDIVIHNGFLFRNTIGNREVKIDLLIGGSPCQDLSIAGKRKGLSGERSGLFWEYVRILKEVKPKYFILENVASMSKENKQIITDALGVEPIMINAALVSAQQRKRLFWTNIKNVTQPEDRNIFLKDILENGITDRLKSYCIDANYAKGANWDQYKKMGRRQLIRIGKLNNGGQADRIYSIEGKSVSLSANGGGRGAKTGLYHIPHGFIKEKITEENKYPTLCGQNPGSKHLICVGNVNPSGKGMNGYVYDSKGKSPTISTNKGEGSKILVNNLIRKLTPIECERLQCLPDNYTDGISNSQRYKCLGNAFNVDVVAHILSFIKK